MIHKYPIGIQSFGEIRKSGFLYVDKTVLVTTSQFIYVMELKRDGTAREALDQILEKQYLQPYASDKRKKIAIGISFSSANREVADYLVEEL